MTDQEDSALHPHHDLHELVEEWRENARGFADEGDLRVAGAIHACADELEDVINEQ